MLARDQVARFSDDVIGLVISCIFVKTGYSFASKISKNKLGVEKYNTCLIDPSNILVRCRNCERIH